MGPFRLTPARLAGMEAYSRMLAEARKIVAEQGATRYRSGERDNRLNIQAVMAALKRRDSE